MFSLIISICFISGDIEICERQTMKDRMLLQDCTDRMELVMQDIKVSPFYEFGWVVQCSKN